MSDLRRWHDAAKWPKVEAGAERVDRAHKFINIIRRLCGYGVAAEIPECGRLAGILDEMRYKQAERRRVKLELDHAEAFADKAIEMGRLSLAIGTIVQFETGMRQREVIGEWRPLAKDEPRTGIVLNKLRWQRGLTWADLSRDLIIQKATTKTGAIISHDLKLMPSVMKVLEMVPMEKRVGPLIIDEDAGRPYANHAYAREWRLVARAAGIPDHVWNSDSRAGAITEAENAGAELDLIRGAVGHTQLSTTARYSRGAIGKSRKIAELPQANRVTKNMSER